MFSCKLPPIVEDRILFQNPSTGRRMVMPNGHGERLTLRVGRLRKRTGVNTMVGMIKGIDIISTIIHLQHNVLLLLRRRKRVYQQWRLKSTLSCQPKSAENQAHNFSPPSSLGESIAPPPSIGPTSTLCRDETHKMDDPFGRLHANIATMKNITDVF